MVASSAGTLRVAIIGGGIGGLAAAAFLHRAGLSSVVYEQAPELKEVGAGLVLAPNAVRLLRRLGAMDRLQHRAVPLDVGWEFRRWQDGRVLSAENLADLLRAALRRTHLHRPPGPPPGRDRLRRPRGRGPAGQALHLRHGARRYRGTGV